MLNPRVILRHESSFVPLSCLDAEELIVLDRVPANDTILFRKGEYVSARSDLAEITNQSNRVYRYVGRYDKHARGRRRQWKRKGRCYLYSHSSQSERVSAFSAGMMLGLVQIIQGNPHSFRSVKHASLSKSRWRLQANELILRVNHCAYYDAQTRKVYVRCLRLSNSAGLARREELMKIAGKPKDSSSLQKQREALHESLMKETFLVCANELIHVPTQNDTIITDWLGERQWRSMIRAQLRSSKNNESNEVCNRACCFRRCCCCIIPQRWRNGDTRPRNLTFVAEEEKIDISPSKSDCKDGSLHSLVLTLLLLFSLGNIGLMCWEMLINNDDNSGDDASDGSSTSNGTTLNQSLSAEGHSEWVYLLNDDDNSDSSDSKKCNTGPAFIRNLTVSRRNLLLITLSAILCPFLFHWILGVITHFVLQRRSKRAPVVSPSAIHKQRREQERVQHQKYVPSSSSLTSIVSDQRHSFMVDLKAGDTTSPMAGSIQNAPRSGHSVMFSMDQPLVAPQKHHASQLSTQTGDSWFKPFDDSGTQLSASDMAGHSDTATTNQALTYSSSTTAGTTSTRNSMANLLGLGPNIIYSSSSDESTSDTSDEGHLGNYGQTATSLNPGMHSRNNTRNSMMSSGGIPSEIPMLIGDSEPAKMTAQQRSSNMLRLSGVQELTEDESIDSDIHRRKFNSTEETIDMLAKDLISVGTAHSSQVSRKKSQRFYANHTCYCSPMLCKVLCCCDETDNYRFTMKYQRYREDCFECCPCFRACYCCGSNYREDFGNDLTEKLNGSAMSEIGSKQMEPHYLSADAYQKLFRSWLMCPILSTMIQLLPLFHTYPTQVETLVYLFTEFLVFFPSMIAALYYVFYKSRRNGDDTWRNDRDSSTSLEKWLLCSYLVFCMVCLCATPMISLLQFTKNRLFHVWSIHLSKRDKWSILVLIGSTLMPLFLIEMCQIYTLLLEHFYYRHMTRKHMNEFILMVAALRFVVFIIPIYRCVFGSFFGRRNHAWQNNRPFLTLGGSLAAMLLTVALTLLFPLIPVACYIVLQQSSLLSVAAFQRELANEVQKLRKSSQNKRSVPANFAHRNKRVRKLLKRYHMKSDLINVGGKSTGGMTDWAVESVKQSRDARWKFTLVSLQMYVWFVMVSYLMGSMHDWKHRCSDSVNTNGRRIVGMGSSSEMVLFVWLVSNLFVTFLFSYFSSRSALLFHSVFV